MRTHTQIKLIVYEWLDLRDTTCWMTMVSRILQHSIHCEKIIEENTAKNIKNAELEIYLVLTHPRVKNYEIWIHKQT